MAEKEGKNKKKSIFDSSKISSTKSPSSGTEWWKKGRGYYYDYYDDYKSYSGSDDEDIEIVPETKTSSPTVPVPSETKTSTDTSSYRGSYYPSGGSYSYGSSYYSGYGYHYGYSGGYYSGGGFYDRYRSSLGYSSTSSKLSASVSGKKFSNITELMSKAYKETREMIIILDFPFEVKVSFSASDGILRGSGDCKYIFLNTKVLDLSSYKDDEKINIICGNGIHEACHLKYTSIKVLDEFEERLRIAADSKSVDSEEEKNIREGNKGFILMISNLIEDMRVENSLLVERPGYSSLLSTSKDYCLNLYNAKFSSKKFSDTAAAEFLDNLIKLIRYPEEINEDVIAKYSETYTEIKNLISPLPKSTKESCQAALKVFGIVTKLFKDLSSTSDIEEITDSILTEISEVADNSCISGVLSGIDGQISPTASKFKESISKMSCDSLDSTASRVVTGEIEAGESKLSYFHKPTGSKAKYEKCVGRIQKYIPAIRKLISGTDKNYDFNIYGCRSGLLDTNKLAEAYQGVPQVYIRTGEVRTNKLAVGILVDESGSMGSNSWYETYNEGYNTVTGKYTGCRSFIARDAAILLNESLKTLPGVDLYIYGHSADITCTGSTELYIYREGKKYAPKYAMSDINGRDENRDGTAILEVAKRIRKNTQESTVLFVLSDGSPSASGYRGSAAVADTAKKVAEVEKMGFTVIQISIASVYDVDMMFKNIVDLTSDMSSLPKALSSVVKKSIVANKKTTIN